MGPGHPRSENQGRRVRSHATPSMIDRRGLLALAAAAPVLALGRTTAAQAPSPSGWPNRFVKLVVPFTPGGGIDGIGRILGARLSEMWGQQVVIENKPGAGGNIASEFVARSAPDGYTMYITAAGLAVNRYLFASINYDPLADFAPVTLICLFPNVLVVPNSSQVRSVSDLLALAKNNPGKVTFASPGHGSSPYMRPRWPPLPEKAAPNWRFWWCCFPRMAQESIREAVGRAALTYAGPPVRYRPLPAPRLPRAAAGAMGGLPTRPCSGGVSDRVEHRSRDGAAAEAVFRPTPALLPERGRASRLRKPLHIRRSSLPAGRRGPIASHRHAAIAPQHVTGSRDQSPRRDDGGYSR